MTDRKTAEEMGERMKQLRKDIHVSQEKMEEYLNIPGKTLSKYEKGKAACTLEVLLFYSVYFGKNLDWLYSGSAQESIAQESAAQESAGLKKMRDYLGQASSEIRKLTIEIVEIFSRCGMLNSDKDGATTLDGQSRDEKEKTSL